MQNIFTTAEELEMRARLPMITAELQSLIEHIKEIRLNANTEPIPGNLSHVSTKHLFKGIYNALLYKENDDGNKLKPPLAKKLAIEIIRQVLGRRITTLPGLHELLVLAPWWISNIGGVVFDRIRDIGLKYILNGRIIPVQKVWSDLLNSEFVFLSPCACRSAKVVDDLYDDNSNVYTIVSEQQGRCLLDRIMDRYNNLISLYGKLPNTDSMFDELFRKLDSLRKANSPQYRIETFLKLTHPWWEIVPINKEYLPIWIPSLHSNRKARVIHRELAFEMVTALYLSRGIIFSTMKLMDMPYGICSCPSPENGGGCVLTNWYYGSGSENSLIPNEEFHGRIKDKDGDILKCQFFPVKSSRNCIGCGCNHQSPNPHEIDTILMEADAYFGSYRLGT